VSSVHITGQAEPSLPRPSSVQGSGGLDDLCRTQLVEYGGEFVNPLAGNASQVLCKTLPVFRGWYLSWRQSRECMERQRRTIGRPDPPAAWFIVDELSLYRLVGSASVMAAQLRRLLDVAAMPGVTVQVLPAIGHPATAGETIITDDAAYVENLLVGAVLTGETVSSLMAVFDSLRGECYRVSESLALIERLAAIWESGVSPLTAARTAGAA
jgi:hypothetical protein